MRLLKGPVPLYVQVENQLRSRIRSGKLSANQSITAKEICQEFGVSSITAYHALENLSNEGIIRLEAGKKTVVTPARENRSAKVIGSVEDIISYARETTYHLLKMATIRPEEKISQLLEIETGAEVVNFTAIRLLGNVPFAYINSYVIHELGSSITEKDFLSHSSLLALVEDTSGVRITRSQQAIKTASVNRTTAKLLQMNIGSPVLWIERLFYHDITPIIFSITQANGEVYPYKIDLLRTGK